jgi:hypothetical protein
MTFSPNNNWAHGSFFDFLSLRGMVRLELRLHPQIRRRDGSGGPQYLPRRMISWFVHVW